MELITKQGTWYELQIKLKEKYPHLTEADLLCKEGGEQLMLRMVEYKLHKSKQEMKEIIEKL